MRNKKRESFMHSSGTTALETFSVIVPAFFLVLISSIMVKLFLKNWHKRLTFRFVVEFFLIVVPIIVIVTIGAEHIRDIFFTLIVVSITFCILAKYGNTVDNSKMSVDKSKCNFITLGRSTINLISVIGILAVDFRIFPRTFAKTKTYGYSLMDVGVGLFIFSNGLVAPELRGYKNSIAKTLKSVAPLLLLGGVRILITKEIDYHVPISEYGVHWNFFITLAVTKIFTSLIFNFIPVENAIFSGISILLAHEVFLQLGLARYVFSNAPRNNFLNANREGIVSSLGYVALYYLSVSFGKFLSVKNNVLKWKTFFKLCLISAFLLYSSLILEKNFGVSRRLANSGYCIWIMFLGIFMVSLFYFGELLLNYIFSQDKNVPIVPFIFDAINGNGLFFFLLSNILTGCINIMIDTLKVGTICSLLIIIFYMLLNCSANCILLVKKIKIKL